MKFNLNSISRFEDILIVFLYVFQLYLPIVKTSSLLLVILLPIRILLSPKSISIVYSVFNNRYIFIIINLYLLLLGFILFATTINLEFELSLCPTIINTLIHLFIAIMIVSLLKNKRRDFRYVLTLLINIFLIQALIQISAFLLPPLQDIIHLFHSTTTIDRLVGYGSLRGLALAGTVFYGLAITYGLIFIFFIKKIIRNPRFTLRNTLYAIILFIGGFFTGRTYFIGVGVAGLYFLLSSISITKKISIIIKIVLTIIISSIVIWSLLPFNVQLMVIQLFSFAFEFLIKYLDTGSMSTSSTDTLATMYFDISLKTFLIGDGIYTESTGSYYLGTDAGYMRTVLYSGIGGLIILMLIDIFILFGHLRLRTKEMQRMGFYIFFYLVLLHIKGEAFAYSIMMHALLFLFYISYLYLDNGINDKIIDN